MPAAGRPAGLRLAPAVVVMSTFLVFLVIPSGPTWSTRASTSRVLRARGLQPVGDRHSHGGLGQREQVRAARRAAGCRPALSPTSCPLLLAVVGVVIQASTLSLQGIVPRPAARLDLRVQRTWPAVPSSPSSWAWASSWSPPKPSSPRPPSTCRSPRASSCRVTRSSTPAFGSFLLHRRVRHHVSGSRRSPPPVPRRLGATRRPRHLGRHPRPAVLFIKLMAVAFLMFWVRSRIPACAKTNSSPGVEVPHPDRAGQHPPNRRLQVAF